ncbi:hypothetical protein PVAP13_4KG066400 [Panicum virgatum]|uniref:Replication protein A 70 kDa DNA-binding subunit B/D first OB fold domain-containing protein n=1 Tax=Panicum virgatum TaxID=38727 RepID=A0A8T0TKH1_PANVG|nr:hypothetical protein PVAP13_4KG066400 [Panicum virgatum]
MVCFRFVSCAIFFLVPPPLLLVVGRDCSGGGLASVKFLLPPLRGYRSARAHFVGFVAGSSDSSEKRCVFAPDLSFRLFRMSLTPLKKVGPEHSCWEVKVRVTRFYEQFDQKAPPNLIRFEFVMLDEEHGAMEAVVPLKWISKHRNYLIEDKVYRTHTDS